MLLLLFEFLFKFQFANSKVCSWTGQGRCWKGQRVDEISGLVGLGRC